jgi:alkylation response protein AidB-like acyl-CoA dehydrogenase
LNFNDTEQEAAYRQKAIEFLEQHAEKKVMGQVGVSARLSPQELLQAAKKWQALKADHDFACISWPKEWGGPGGSAIESVIFAQEEQRFDIPEGIFQVSLGVCMPSVIKLGSEELKNRFVKPALRGEEIWCQLFSEPAAGSDLAGIRTRAERTSEGWIINGQKVWTSNAHLSDFGLLLTRTDPSVVKHSGLTMFWVDMRTPGIEVRPINQISGQSGFNEVYFTDVSIPDAQRISEVGGGWKAAMGTLATERLAIGGAKGADCRELVALAAELPCESGTVLKDSHFRQKLADWYVNSEGINLTRMRALTTLSRGGTPGPEMSIAKLVMAEQLQQLCDYAMDLQAEFGIINSPEISEQAAVFQKGWLKAPGSRIAGGTDEILMNVIAERVLGMPGEIRVDKDLPFNELPVGI